MLSAVTHIISIFIILMSLAFASILAFTYQMEEDLSGTKRTIFIILLLVYSVYRSYRLYTSIRDKKMKTKTNQVIVTCFLISYMFQSCTGNERTAIDQKKYDEKTQTIYVDESFKPLIETCLYTFEGFYPLTETKLVYQPEIKSINALLKDKTQTIVVSRDFSKAEKIKMRSSQIEVRSTIIARDACALIVNNSSADSLLTITQLKNILLGKMTVWPSTGEKIELIFDNVQSSNFNQLSELINRAPFGKNVFAVKSNNEVVDYVKKHNNAIGVVGYNWLSDAEDPMVMYNRNETQLVGIARTEKDTYWLPYPADIEKKDYPLTREIWAITKASAAGNSASFIHFMMGQKGQLIVEKSGLIPSLPQARRLDFKFE